MAVTELPEAGSPEATAPPRRGLRYNSPLVQVSLIGLVCFCCPGMFNALSGLGGGGQFDHTTADNANTALYACFAVFGILGGAAHNLLGPRLTLLLGSLTYPLYAASFLYYNHRKSQVFPITLYVGFYKGVQSAGAAVAWQVDTHKTSLLSQLIVNWGLMTVSYPLLAVLVLLAVKDEDYSVSNVDDAGKEKDTKMAAPSSFH